MSQANVTLVSHCVRQSSLLKIQPKRLVKFSKKSIIPTKTVLEICKFWYETLTILDHQVHLSDSNCQILVYFWTN